MRAEVVVVVSPCRHQKSGHRRGSKKLLASIVVSGMVPATRLTAMFRHGDGSRNDETAQVI